MMKNERWIPKGYKQVRRNEKYGIAVYSDGKNSAIAYSGKRTKHDFYYRFGNAEHMSAHIDDYMKSTVANAKADEKRKAERRAELQKPTTLKVGDILCYSWGWEQTNIDFFQVVEAKKRTIKISPIASDRTETNFMAGTCVPVKDSFIEQNTLYDPVMTKRVGAGESIKMPCGWAHKWDGRPMYWSAYA